MSVGVKIVRRSMNNDKRESNMVDDIKDVVVPVASVKSEEVSVELKNEDVIPEPRPQINMDSEKLAKLREDMKLKFAPKKVEVKVEKVSDRSKTAINISCIGSGQAGGRIASAFYKRGMDAIAVNTASSDLDALDLPASNKLLFDYGLGGAAKNLDMGLAAANEYREQLKEMIKAHLASSLIVMVAASAGGGSGAGSLPVLVDVLNELGKACIVISILPSSEDDNISQKNALETLSFIGSALQDGKIASSVIVDNAKLMINLQGVSELDFYDKANELVIDPLVRLNNLASRKSPTKGIDATEESRLLIDGNGFMIYATIDIENYKEDTGIAEGVINHLNSSLLAEGFDISEAKYGAFILGARKSVFEQVSATSIGYALSVMTETVPGASAVYRGTYILEDDEIEDGIVRVYTFISGLGNPTSRIDALVKTVAQAEEALKAKTAARTISLGIKTEKDKTISAVDRIKNKIAENKKSSFNSFTANVIDKRKK